MHKVRVHIAAVAAAEEEGGSESATGDLGRNGRFERGSPGRRRLDRPPCEAVALLEKQFACQPDVGAYASIRHPRLGQERVSFRPRPSSLASSRLRSRTFNLE